MYAPVTTPPKTKAVQRRLIVLAALRIVALSGASVLGAQTANPESPVQIEKLETTYRFECDGSGQMKVHARWQALTAAGVKMVSQFSIPYASELEEVRVAYFKTVKKNGETLEGDSKQVFESTPRRKYPPPFSPEQNSSSLFCQTWKSATASSTNSPRPPNHRSRMNSGRFTFRSETLWFVLNR